MSSSTQTPTSRSWATRIPTDASTRGVGTRGLPQFERPKRSRVLLALLLVIGTALAVAVVVMQAGGKVEVIAIRDGHSVAKGEVIDRADLQSRSVSGIAGAYAVGEVDRVVGKTAAVDLVAGEVLLPDMLTADLVPGAGEALVGLSLDPARIPATGLQAGDLVDVVAVPEAGGTGRAGGGDPADLEAPRLLSERARVYAVEGDGTAGGQQLLTVIVKAPDAARLAAYSTSNRVAVVEISSTATSSGQEH